MDRNTALVALAGIIFGTVFLVTVITTIAKAVVAHRRALALPDGGVARLEQRLERIEQAIDAMSVEVERISEGQRFTTKLLAERTTEPA